MKLRLQAFFITLILSGCIGTDYLEDPIVGERIEVSPLQAALMPGQAVQLTAVYFDPYGIERDAMLIWTSSATEVAVVDENGMVTGITVGQATITASFQTAVSEAVTIAVVSDENAVASVVVTSPKLAVELGEKVTLSVMVKNINGSILEGRTVEWFSENSSIVTVNAQGEVTAVANGIAAVHAKSESIKSNSVDFVVGSARTGTFVSAGGYNAEGMAVLRMENGNLLLEFNDNFKTSYALGTYVYLSNSTSGSATFSGGLEVAQIFADGPKSFNISALHPDVGLFDYRYIIILCKPARVTFGFADMN